MRKVFYRVASKNSVKPGQAMPIHVGDDGECLLVRTADGEFHTVGALCPHQNEPLDHGRVEGCEIVCRRHHLRFAVGSGACTNAAGYSLRTLETRVDGDDVLVGRWED